MSKIEIDPKAFIDELIEEVVTAAVDFGRSDSIAAETALAESTEMLYNAIKKFVK